MNAINAVRPGHYFDPHAALGWLRARHPGRYAPERPAANVTLDLGAVLESAHAERSAVATAPPAAIAAPETRAIVRRALDHSDDERRELDE